MQVLQPEDAANAVAWLVSHEARYVAGQRCRSMPGRSTNAVRHISREK